MHRTISIFAVFAILVTGISHKTAVAKKKRGRAIRTVSQVSQKPLNEREMAFSKKLTNAVLVGKFSVVGAKDQKPPEAERYEITKASRFKGETWIIQARVKYGKVDVTLPIPLTVRWAGDTPMMSLTDATIPGMGAAFSCRVLFYGDRYAGTWQHGKKGGHLWGTIESKKIEPAKQPADAKGAAKTPDLSVQPVSKTVKKPPLENSSPIKSKATEGGQWKKRGLKSATPSKEKPAESKPIIKQQSASPKSTEKSEEAIPPPPPES